MATGVKPRNEDSQLTRSDLDAIQDAMKSQKFRDLFVEYCKEIRDPANQALYQKEITQLEKERGFDVTFINPKEGYVIKTSVAGDRKAFINICSSEEIAKPRCAISENKGKKGMSWEIPYSLIPPREDFDNKRQRCVIYDVVFHPDTLRMATKNSSFRDLVNKTAFDGLQKTYKIQLDMNNLRYPRSFYKGLSTPAVIRKEDPNFKQSAEDEEDSLPSELLDKLYPQRVYNKSCENSSDITNSTKASKKANSEVNNNMNKVINGYTIPKYVIKQQKSVELEEFTYNKNCKQFSATPNKIVVQIHLPLLTSTKNCTLDVKEKSLSLVSEEPAKYKLNIDLPYNVDDQCGSAKFDKTKHMLIVSLPVVLKNSDLKMIRSDSGVESDDNGSDEITNSLVTELSSGSVGDLTTKLLPTSFNTIKDDFLVPNISYTFPAYTFNIIDQTIAFTFHVQNVDPDSVVIQKKNTVLGTKFTSVGSGFVPVHYMVFIYFDEDTTFDVESVDTWDNNVILLINVKNDMPQVFKIGLTEDSMELKNIDSTSVKDSKEKLDFETKGNDLAVLQVNNSSNETNIVLSSCTDNNNIESDQKTDKSKLNVADDVGNYLPKRTISKPQRMARSFSESSVGDVASSVDCVSSDCIPEEGSSRKTVRFNDVIARKFYRYNSSIEGQKRKNQRKKNKKRNQNRTKSESEAEDDIFSRREGSRPFLKPAIKQRRDSGLADTSDAEGDAKGSPGNYSSDDGMKGSTKFNVDFDSNPSVFNIANTNGSNAAKPLIWEHNTVSKDKLINKITCDNIKHNTDLYDPDKLNKGQYTEVSFKNDLIFDLDM